MYEEIEISGADTSSPLNISRRIDLLLKVLPRRPCNLLDCGCGAGGYLRALQKMVNINPIGIEYDRQKLNVARQDVVDPLRVIQGDIGNLPFKTGTFDAVMVNEVLEHLPDQDSGLSEIYRVLRPRGKLLVFSPNRLYPFETHGVSLKVSGRHIPHWVPLIPWIPLALGTKVFSYPARNYWPLELVSLLQSHGFKVIEKHFIWQTFEGISGSQPALIRRFSKGLRNISFFLERVPILRSFGVSQFIALEKV